MTEIILCVDDDPNILQAYQRALRKQLNIVSALGGEEALKAIADQGPYAVIVADMQMPGMNGVELLAKVKEISPDTVRMMLTGNADQHTALEAVNEGHIFRFMTKPCPPETFAKALEAGLAQYRLITAEREVLSKTLSGAVKMLTEVLSLVSPAAFGRASRVRQLVRKLVKQLGLKQAWQIEIAAMLSQVGCVALAEETLEKVHKGEQLSRIEAEEYRAHPQVARELVANIPRLDQVADIIAYQEQRYDGQGSSPNDKRGEELPLGSRILKVALDFDTLVSVVGTPELAMAEIDDREGWYDPAVAAALRSVLQVEDVYVVRPVKVSQLLDGTFIAADVESLQGTLLCARGQEVTSSLRIRLRNYVGNLGIKEQIRVFVLEDMADQIAERSEVTEGVR